MTDLRQAAQQALDALEHADKDGFWREQRDAITALKAALEQQAEPVCPDCKAAVLYECVACSSNNYPPQQKAEPVAWMDREGDLYKMPEIPEWAPPHTMLYTTPPQRQWVGLTDEQLDDIVVVARRGNLHDLRIAIEAAHGIKD